MVKGHKRHILVDTLGLLLQVIVSAANVSKRAGTQLLLEKIEGQFPRLQKIFADGGYDGKDFMTSFKEDYQLDWGDQTQAGKGIQGLALAMDSGKNYSLVCPLSPINY